MKIEETWLPVSYLNSKHETPRVWLPLTDQALYEIAFAPEMLPHRIEKERKAVLAEMQQVNVSWQIGLFFFLLDIDVCIFLRRIFIFDMQRSVTQDMEYRIETWTLSGLHETNKLGSFLSCRKDPLFFGWKKQRFKWMDLGISWGFDVAKSKTCEVWLDVWDFLDLQVHLSRRFDQAIPHRQRGAD